MTLCDTQIQSKYVQQLAWWYTCVCRHYVLHDIPSISNTGLLNSFRSSCHGNFTLLDSSVVKKIHLVDNTSLDNCRDMACFLYIPQASSWNLRSGLCLLGTHCKLQKLGRCGPSLVTHAALLINNQLILQCQVFRSHDCLGSCLALSTRGWRLVKCTLSEWCPSLTRPFVHLAFTGMLFTK